LPNFWVPRRTLSPIFGIITTFLWDQGWSQNPFPLIFLPERHCSPAVGPSKGCPASPFSVTFELVSKGDYMDYQRLGTAFQARTARRIIFLGLGPGPWGKTCDSYRQSVQCMNELVSRIPQTLSQYGLILVLLLVAAPFRLDCDGFRSL
jgi:hypothetical protein